MTSVTSISGASDRIGERPNIFQLVKRRFRGQYAVDRFGADPVLVDITSNLAGLFVRAAVHGGEHLPERGPAVIIANRSQVIAPTVLAIGVRSAVNRRLRVVGVPNMPIASGIAEAVAALRPNHHDIGAALRSGYLVAMPAGESWFVGGHGHPSISILRAAVGYPVIPAYIAVGGPGPLPIRPWQLYFGAPISVEVGETDHDPLAAAELAERIGPAIASLKESACLTCSSKTAYAFTTKSSGIGTVLRYS